MVFSCPFPPSPSPREQEVPEDQAAEGEKQAQEKESLAAMEDKLREATKEQLTEPLLE